MEIDTLSYSEYVLLTVMDGNLGRQHRVLFRVSTVAIQQRDNAIYLYFVV